MIGIVATVLNIFFVFFGILELLHTFPRPPFQVMKKANPPLPLSMNSKTVRLLNQKCASWYMSLKHALLFQRP